MAPPSEYRALGDDTVEFQQAAGAALGGYNSEFVSFPCDRWTRYREAGMTLGDGVDADGAELGPLF